jgi:hypothetical protein
LWFQPGLLSDFYAMAAEWARWATEMAARWPDEPAKAVANPSVFEETVRRAAEVVYRRPDGF